jgi:hypothetical protein
MMYRPFAKDLVQHKHPRSDDQGVVKQVTGNGTPPMATGQPVERGIVQSLDVFGVTGLTLGVVALLLFFVPHSVFAPRALALGIIGGGCSLFGRGTLRVSGLTVNGSVVCFGLLACLMLWMTKSFGPL